MDRLDEGEAGEADRRASHEAEDDPAHTEQADVSNGHSSILSNTVVTRFRRNVAGSEPATTGAATGSGSRRCQLLVGKWVEPLAGRSTAAVGHTSTW